MAVLIAGPTGVDVLVEPAAQEAVNAVAARAARELGLDSDASWGLARADGQVIDPALTADTAALALEPGLQLIARSTPAAGESGGPDPHRPTPDALPLGPAPTAGHPPSRHRVDARPLRTPTPAPPRPPPGRRVRVAAGAAAGLLVGVLVGVGIGRHDPAPAPAPPAPPTETAPVTTTAPGIVLDGVTAGLGGPVDNLAADNTARPGQILHAPQPQTGTAVAWRWQTCPASPEPCQDIPDATHEIYTAPPTAAPITIRCLVDTTLPTGAHLTWVSAPFQALPPPPPTTTTTTTSPPPPPTEAPVPEPPPSDPAASDPPPTP